MWQKAHKALPDKGFRRELNVPHAMIGDQFSSNFNPFHA
jgi:hypothetical protein